MTDLMNLLLDYACKERVPRFLDCTAYDEAAILEKKHLGALREGLSARQADSLERCLEAREDLRSLELEAVFLAGFSIARELA